jgi:hypothetical protein
VQAPANQQQRGKFVHMHDACDLLNLLALQLEHGTPLSQRIFRVLQESHCDGQHMAPTEKFQARVRLTARFEVVPSKETSMSSPSSIVPAGASDYFDAAGTDARVRSGCL